MCFSASSNNTSPVSVSDFTIIFLDARLLLLIPGFSSSILPRKPSSIKIHPRRPLEMLSFQNDVYPWKMKKYIKN